MEKSSTEMQNQLIAAALWAQCGIISLEVLPEEHRCSEYNNIIEAFKQLNARCTILHASLSEAQYESAK